MIAIDRTPFYRPVLVGIISRHYGFLGNSWEEILRRALWYLLVAVSHPNHYDLYWINQYLKDVPLNKFLPHPTVEAFNKAVLCWHPLPYPEGKHRKTHHHHRRHKPTGATGLQKHHRLHYENTWGWCQTRFYTQVLGWEDSREGGGFVVMRRPSSLVGDMYERQKGRFR